jgi:hypothetical protein
MGYVEVAATNSIVLILDLEKAGSINPKGCKTALTCNSWLRPGDRSTNERRCSNSMSRERFYTRWADCCQSAKSAIDPLSAVTRETRVHRIGHSASRLEFNDRNGALGCLGVHGSGFVLALPLSWEIVNCPGFDETPKPIRVLLLFEGRTYER